MAHLKKNAAGHLLKNAAGHLVKRCQAVIPGVSCGNCTVTPKTVTVVTSGITICPACFFWDCDPDIYATLTGPAVNDTYVLTQLDANPCAWRAVVGGYTLKGYLTEQHCIDNDPADTWTDQELWVVLVRDTAWAASLYLQIPHTGVNPNNDADCVVELYYEQFACTENECLTWPGSTNDYVVGDCAGTTFVGGYGGTATFST